jgi:hypothetical protein
MRCALRATLTALTLWSTQLWRNHAAAAALLDALTGHARLRKLRIIADASCRFPSEANQQCASALLGALVAADAPALTALDVSYSDLCDTGLGPLFEALPGNTHLRELDCSSNHNVSDAFAADVLLPAVRANTSLRKFTALFYRLQTLDASLEAEALVKSRGSEAPL